jgi:DNA-binding MarR family transcriptional regulator
MPPKDRGAAAALVDVAPLVTRWIERLLAGLPTPLTLAQYLVLRAAAEGEVLAAELARAAGVSDPAVSQVVTPLERAGLVVRQRSQADRRRFPLVLTAAGRTSLAEAQAELEERMAAMLEPLPRPESGALARGLPRVLAALAGHPLPRRPPPPHHPPHGPKGHGPPKRN